MRQLTAGKIVKYGLIGFVALVFIFPIYWMIVTSLKPNSVIMRLPPQFLPTHPIADHYISVLSDHRFFTFYKNSVIVAVLTTGVTLMLAILASYSFSRFRYRFSGPLQMLFLSTQMFPAVVLLIALYTMYSKCGLINTYTALVLACTTSALPLSILVRKGFFDTVSATIEEAATIDGAGIFTIYYKICMPLVKPAALTLVVFSFQGLWNTTGGSYIYEEVWKLVPTVLNDVAAGGMARVGAASAASVLLMIPPCVLFITLESRIVETMAFSGIKG